MTLNHSFAFIIIIVDTGLSILNILALIYMYYDSYWYLVYLTIIPRTRVGYEFLDSDEVSNKCELNNCFVKYQTLNKNISNFIFYQLEFSTILREKFL